MRLLYFTHTTQYFSLVRKRHTFALQIANLLFCGKSLFKIEHTVLIITQAAIEQAELAENLPFITPGYYTEGRHYGCVELD